MAVHIGGVLLYYNPFIYVFLSDIIQQFFFSIFLYSSGDWKNRHGRKCGCVEFFFGNHVNDA